MGRTYTPLTDEIRKAQKALLTTPPGGRKRGKRVSRHNTAWGVDGFESDALGVGVDQIPAARAELAKHGVDCEFNARTGAAKMKSQKHYRDVCRALGMYSGRDGYVCPGAPVGKTGRAVEEGKREFKEALFGDN